MDSADIHTERARALVELNRYPQAIAELQKALILEPDNLYALVLICGSYYDSKDYPSSHRYADKLLEVAPENGLSHYYKAINLDIAGKAEESMKFIRQAIALDPYDADYFTFLSALHMDKSEWEQALHFAEEGLKVDPEHSACLNRRASCLMKLGRKAELDEGIEHALLNHPDNPHTHSNVGWLKLEQSQPQEARKHFTEALRLEPGLESARLGLIESIKARNIIYRLFQQYFFWMQRHQSAARWAIIVGILVGMRLIRVLGALFPPALALYLLVVLFVYLTWIATPFSNLLLKTDKVGSLALNDKENKAANIVGIGLAVALLAFILALVSKQYTWIILFVYAVTVVIPLSNYYEYEFDTPLKEKRVVRLLLSLAIIGLLGFLFSWFMVPLASALLGIYLIGLVAHNWIVNFIRMR